MTWFRSHLNWTWIIWYVLILCLAYSRVIYMTQQPLPMMKSLDVSGHFESTPPLQLYTFDSQGKQIPAETITMPKKWVDDPPRYVVDKDALQVRNISVALFWFWPIYLLGTILVSSWVLKQKRQSLKWLWLTMLVFPITPLVLSKKNLTVSEPSQSQTSVVDRSDGCSETHIHSDKTGDI